jgi:hypothetical protein
MATQPSSQAKQLPLAGLEVPNATKKAVRWSEHQEIMYVLLHTFAPFFLLFPPFALSKGSKKAAKGILWFLLAKGAKAKTPCLPSLFSNLFNLVPSAGFFFSL